MLKSNLTQSSVYRLSGLTLNIVKAIIVLQGLNYLDFFTTTGVLILPGGFEVNPVYGVPLVLVKFAILSVLMFWTATHPVNLKWRLTLYGICGFVGAVWFMCIANNLSIIWSTLK